MSGNSSNAKPNAIPKIFESNPTFVDFTRRILSVPHSDIKAKMDAEKAAKQEPKRSASRDSVVPSKVR
jgi:hypothetical protein